MQSEINIGLVGHVDHGKTSLAEALSGIWTDTHSEEIKRGISIKIGYADCEFYKCPKCKGSEAYSTKKKCPECGTKTKFLRKISLVDAPGHGTLMAIMLSGAALMDGAILVISANEPCPQPQTAEHLEALNILGVNRIVIAQNKIDLVSKKEAIENYKQIKNFIKGSVAGDAPIIPIAAHYGANIDALIEAIEEVIPIVKKVRNKDPLMYVARSFDVNKPGIGIEEIKGGVIGGSIVQGEFKVGDEIEISPGLKRTRRGNGQLRTKIVSLNTGKYKLDVAHPGGLIAIGTSLDPSLTKADSLIGNVVGVPGRLPEVYDTLTLDITLFRKLIGTKEEPEVKPLIPGEQLMLSAGTAITSGIIKEVKKGEIALGSRICAIKGKKLG